MGRDCDTDGDSTHPPRAKVERSARWHVTPGLIAFFMARKAWPKDVFSEVAVTLIPAFGGPFFCFLIYVLSGSVPLRVSVTFVVTFLALSAYTWNLSLSRASRYVLYFALARSKMRQATDVDPVMLGSRPSALGLLREAWRLLGLSRSVPVTAQVFLLGVSCVASFLFALLLRVGFLDFGRVAEKVTGPDAVILSALASCFAYAAAVAVDRVWWFVARQEVTCVTAEARRATRQSGSGPGSPAGPSWWPWVGFLRAVPRLPRGDVFEVAAWQLLSVACLALWLRYASVAVGNSSVGTTASMVALPLFGAGWALAGAVAAIKASWYSLRPQVLELAAEAGQAVGEQAAM